MDVNAPHALDVEQEELSKFSQRAGQETLETTTDGSISDHQYQAPEDNSEHEDNSMPSSPLSAVEAQDREHGDIHDNPLTPTVITDAGALINPPDEAAQDPHTLDLRTIFESTRRLLIVVPAPNQPEYGTPGGITPTTSGNEQPTDTETGGPNMAVNQAHAQLGDAQPNLPQTFPNTALTTTDTTSAQEDHAISPTAPPSLVQPIASLSYIRANGLNATQITAFNLWLQNAQAEWDLPDHGADDYDPSADSDQLQTWWLMQAQRDTDVYRTDTTLPFFDPGRGVLYYSDMLEEDIRDSLPKVTISATLPVAELTGDATIDEAAKLNHARLIEAMKNPCQICGENFVEGYATKCSHIACVECMIQWLRGACTCPVCRVVLLHSEARVVTLGDVEDGDGLSCEAGGQKDDMGCGWAEQELPLCGEDASADKEVNRAARCSHDAEQ
jgi:hypothetical protein